MVLDATETFEPKRGELIQDGAFMRNRIRQNHIKSRKAIGSDKKECLAQIKNFAHLPTAQFFDSRKVDKGLWRVRHKCDMITPCPESSSNREREFCTDTTGFSPAKC